MCWSKSWLNETISCTFLVAMCIMYPQQIGGLVGNALRLFGDLFSQVLTPIFLKAIGA